MASEHDLCHKTDGRSKLLILQNLYLESEPTAKGQDDKRLSVYAQISSILAKTDVASAAGI